MRIDGPNIGAVWSTLLNRLLLQPVAVSPRGAKTRELIGVQLHVYDAHNNILISDVRNLNYRFMIAEWLWIWFGHNDVKTIAQYNKEIAKFSDDGVTFRGAYGPPVRAGIAHVIQKLTDDRDSRQAVIDIYGNTEAAADGYKTKDVPCTLTLQFLVRGRVLHVIANMRSSDVWLGLPYDFFNFTMIANSIAAELGMRIGQATLNLGSSHLYVTNETDAKSAAEGVALAGRSPHLPRWPTPDLDIILQYPNEKSYPGDIEKKLMRPWFDYANILRAQSRVEARDLLMALSSRSWLV